MQSSLNESDVLKLDCCFKDANYMYVNVICAKDTEGKFVKLLCHMMSDWKGHMLAMAANVFVA